jgi:hypothetical protein
MKTLIITPKNKQSGVFLKKLLSKLSDVKRIEEVEEKNEVPFVRLSESSLEKEWKSDEDEIWDNWAKEKLKNTRLNLRWFGFVIRNIDLFSSGTDCKSAPTGGI